jgi:hypothetical protein
MNNSNNSKHTNISASEYSKLTELSKDDYTKIANAWSKRSAEWRILKSNYIFIILVTFIITAPMYSILKIVAGILSLCLFYILVKRQGEDSGHLLGYQDGYFDGINKALAIDDELSGKLLQKATDIEIESMNSNTEGSG